MQNVEVSKFNKFRGFILNSTLAAAATLSLTGFAYGVPVSNNLPVPNYVNGAALQYSSGYKINSTAGNLSSSVQNSSANAANSSSKLNFDLGTKAGSVADLRYNTFNIGQRKTVNFKFGADGQAALNRVNKVGSQFASSILGNITQSGKGGGVFLINPNGILFGAKSRINVDSFTASSLNYSSDTLKNTSSRTIILSKGKLPANGIYFEKGSAFNTPKSTVFVSEGIIDNGTNINAGKGNVQFLTGDGVNLKYFYDFSSSLAPSSFVTASTVTPDKVNSINGANDPFNAIDIKGSVRGHNINIISKINRKLTAPFEGLVNIDGILTAGTVVKSDSGQITLYADNINSSGRTSAGSAGVEIGGTVTAGVNKVKYPGSVLINSDSFKFKDNGSIRTDYLNLVPITAGKGIVFGTSTVDNIVPDFAKIQAENITVGNNSNSAITGTLDLMGKNNSAINLTLATTGDINLDINKVNDNSILNFTNPDSVSIFAVFTSESFGNPQKLRMGEIGANGDVSINTRILTDVVVGPIDAKGNISLTGIESIFTAGNLTSGGNISLNADLATFTTGNLIAGGNVRLESDSGSGLTVGNISAGQDMSVNMFQAVLNTGNIRAKGSFTGNFFGNSGPCIFNSGSINVGKDFVINGPTGAGDGEINSGSIKAGNSINIKLSGLFNLPGDRVINTGNLTANSDITLSAPDSINTGNINTGGSLTSGFINKFDTLVKAESIKMKNITARGNVNLSAHTVSTGNIEAGGTLNIDKD